MLTSRQMPEIIYNIAMIRFLKVLAILFFVCFCTQASFAEDYKILVLPDTIQFERTNYLIYPDAATMFASDTINELKKCERLQVVNASQVRDALRKNMKLSLLTRKALKEYKYNYNISFVDFKSIAHQFSANKILLITSQTDVQNYILRRTFCDIVNLPGESVVNPSYKVSTYVALIDVDKEEVLWQSNYSKIMNAFEGRIVAQNFAPATEQLEKMRTYSQYFLSPNLSMMVQAKLFPPILPPKKGALIDVSNTNVGTPEMIIPPIEELELQQKKLAPSKTTTNGYGAIINDL